MKTTKTNILFFLACIISTVVFGQDLDGKTFILENYSNGKALAVNGINIGKNGTQLHSWPLAKANKHQHWKFIASGDGSKMYYIVNVSPQTKKANYLEVSSFEVGKNGGKVQMWGFNGGSSSSTGANQVWIVNQSADGYYNFTSAHEKGKGAYALELSGDDIDKNGGRMQIWWNKGYKNQKWNLIDVSNVGSEAKISTLSQASIVPSKFRVNAYSINAKSRSGNVSDEQILADQQKEYWFASTGDGKGYIKSGSQVAKNAIIMEIEKIDKGNGKFAMKVKNTSGTDDYYIVATDNKTIKIVAGKTIPNGGVFKATEALTKDKNSAAKYASFESVSYPGYFLRHQGFVLKLTSLKGLTGSSLDLFQKDASWRLIEVK
ncbi:hypothetical protein SCB49_09690 [unidentified eubacterium SCB49]|nr:hypothetical protein SCB49_09690 [unidentified eubacterium SCB49]